MNPTDYVLAIIEAHPSTTQVYLQANASIDAERVPSHVTVESWPEGYSEARNAEDFVLVRFNV
jgi:hypothetical protein